MVAQSKGRRTSKVVEADPAEPPPAPGAGAHSGLSTPAAEPSPFDILRECAPALIQRALRLALAGDRKALFWCLERALPPTRSSDAVHPRLDLPPVESPADVAAFTGRLLDAVRCGELGPDEARALASVLAIHLQALGVADLDDRLSTMERKRR